MSLLHQLRARGVEVHRRNDGRQEEVLRVAYGSTLMTVGRLLLSGDTRRPPEPGGGHRESPENTDNPRAHLF